jgi:hypothetical protein
MGIGRANRIARDRPRQADDTFGRLIHGQPP